MSDETHQTVNDAAALEPVDFNEMTIDDLARVLDLTIRYDDENKCILFLGFLTAYTEADQLNLYINGPSSSGKTYLVTEVAKYFPEEDVEEYASASPTSFIHRYPTKDPETGRYYIDCERKILLFLELPHHQLQAKLRPFLSHDKKEIVYLTTDKNKRGGNRAKESRLRGYAATAFCSVSMRMDDQEATRAILLSPEVSEAKLTEGIELSMLRTADPAKYQEMIDNDPLRQQLKRRVRAIKELHINSVIIPDPETVLTIFKQITKKPKPRHQRDIAHLGSLIKAVALINAWWRLDDQRNVVANEADVEQAILLWKRISTSQELGIPPFAYNFYKTFIVPAFEEKNGGRQPELVEANGATGVTRADIRAKHFQLTGQMVNEDDLRRNILPTLEAASLIIQEKDPANGKQIVIFPKYSRNEYSGDDTVAENEGGNKLVNRQLQAPKVNSESSGTVNYVIPENIREVFGDDVEMLGEPPPNFGDEKPGNEGGLNG